MIEIGKINKLTVIREETQGIYLNELYGEAKDILLPKGQVPMDTHIGDELEVFVYRDSEDRIIATTNRPKLMLGEVGTLKVVSVNRIGAFLDWGLERDLFLPFKEQIQKLHQGEVHVVGMYIDKSHRLCATMKVYDLLRCDSPYKVNDEVNGIIYSIKEAFGAFVAVNGKYHGLIPVKELYGKYKLGDHLSLRVKSVKMDGKLELSLRKPTHLQMEDDARRIMEELEAQGGKLPLHDKSSPEEINHAFNMSKAAFKRAIGRLMKEGVIEIKADGISRTW